MSDILREQHGYEFIDDQPKKDFILEEVTSNLDVWKELDRVIANEMSTGKYSIKIKGDVEKWQN